jgi:uncharacterized protein (TIGR04255 family)
MRGHETFPKAPILEATVDFEAGFRIRPRVEVLDRYSDAVKETFPNRRERHTFNPSLTVGGNEPLLRNARSQIIELRSEDDKYVMHVKRDGFSFTRLQPYTHWDDFCNRSLKGWHLYRDIFHPPVLRAISLRYFNGIDLPNPVRMKDYFRTRITLPSGVPQNVNNTFFSFSFFSTNKSTGTVSFFLDLSAYNEQRIRVIFLIAVRQPLDVPSNNDKRIMNALSSLRHTKNRIFFNSITEKMKEEFRC